MAEYDLKQLSADVDAGVIDTVLTCMIDMQGRLIGKRVTGKYFVERGWRELHACDYLLTVDMEMEPVPGFEAASWAQGYGDFEIRPDMSTLRRIPWLEATALVLCDCLDHHGEPVPHAPRSILKKQVERLKERGLTAFTASELEFYLFNETFASAAEKDYRNLVTAATYIEDYHILQTTKEEPVIRRIRNDMEGAGIPIEFSKGEWGPGQEEINLRYADALEMADRHVIYKNGVKEIAHAEEKAVTFMAKWRSDLAGSSCHIHLSLWDNEKDCSAFHENGADDDMTPLFRQFLAGLLKATPDITAFLAPNVNSYKRFQSGSFAPTKIIWSRDNRTAGYRILGHDDGFRLECRVPGADVNPYLAYAAMIAAGLDGVENQLEMPAEFVGNAYDDQQIPEIPKTLVEAVGALETSEVLRGAMGDHVVDHYVHAARWEIAEHDKAVTDFERARLFERG